MSGPPPRWLRCPRKGDICYEKFLPFKVPLKSRYDPDVPEEYRFPPKMMFDHAKRYKKKVSYILSLETAIYSHKRKGYTKLTCKAEQ